MIKALLMAKTDPEIIFLFRFDILHLPFDLINGNQLNLFRSNHKLATRIIPS